MAANLWLSTHCRQWLPGKDEIEAALNSQNGRFEPEAKLSSKDFQNMKRFYSQYIQRLGKSLKLRQRIVASAIVYLRRFYFRHSFLEYDALLLCPAAIYLASKVEECSVHVKQIVLHLTKLDPSNQYSEKHILESEFFLLNGLRFDLVIFHPYRPLTQYLSDARLQDCAQTAWYIVNDSYRTDLCLCYPPYLIAIACICAAAAIMMKDTSPWLSQLQVDPKQVADIVVELLDLYRSTSEQVLVSGALQDKLEQHGKWKHFRPSARKSVLEANSNVNGKRPHANVD